MGLVYTVHGLCKRNNEVWLNHYDNGLEIGAVNLVLLHALKDPKLILRTWSFLSPFIERAFMQGKIDSGNLYMYDYWLNEHFGYQYYKLLDDTVPVKNQEKLAERRLRLGL